MNMELLREILELNQAFERAIEGLRRLEKTGNSLLETVRQRRAEIVSIQVEANREFLDQYESALTDDEEWAAKCLRQCKERSTDREDAYVQVMDREATRKKKGLPPRVTFLANWDAGDEERYHEAHASVRRRKATRKDKAQTRKRSKARGK